MLRPLPLVVFEFSAKSDLNALLPEVLLFLRLLVFLSAEPLIDSFAVSTGGGAGGGGAVGSGASGKHILK